MSACKLGLRPSSQPASERASAASGNDVNLLFVSAGKAPYLPLSAGTQQPMNGLLVWRRRRQQVHVCSAGGGWAAGRDITLSFLTSSSEGLSRGADWTAAAILSVPSLRRRPCRNQPEPVGGGAEERLLCPQRHFSSAPLLPPFCSATPARR